jgi:SAM-dependent methyltransferase
MGAYCSYQRAKIDRLPISANFPTFATLYRPDYIFMNQNYFFLFVASALAFHACRSEAPNASDNPSMFREKPAPATTVSEPLPLPKTGAGSFESLVADYESKDRGIWQKPQMVISILGDLETKTVADIGAGTGYFTFRMVPKAQKVIGIDIDPRFISFMDSVRVRMDERFKSRFETRLAKPTDPLLKPQEADAVTMVNTYGYVENRVQYLKTLAKGLKPGGQVLIIDFKKNNLPVGPPDEFKVALSQVERELLAAGLNIEKVDTDALDYQYIVLASKPFK